MWDVVAILVAVDAIESEIGDVMLAARVEASADFDAQILDSLIDRSVALNKAAAKFTRQTA